MPKVVAEYKAQARARIIDAAQVVFRRKGFRAATMDDIAKEIGVSKGALYLYFRTKTALLSEIQGRARQQALDSWETLLEGGDIAEGIARSLDEVFSGKVDPGVWHELTAEAASNPGVRAAIRADAREDSAAMRRFLERLENRKRIRKLRDRDLVADIILALLQASVLDLMLHGRPKESRRRLVDSLRYLLELNR
jgi:AcrR family transcriptional regulator